MLYRWQGGHAAGSGSGDVSARLARELRIHPLVATLLCNRGLSDPAAAEPFLQPRLNDLHDPALMPGLAPAAERLDKAVRDRQPIVIYGDYDVDGVASSAILYHTLKLAGGDVHTYIPHRVDEGYGLNAEALLSLGKAHARTPLIVSVDCGITAIEPARAAKQAGIELIITDHHEFAEEGFPDASILVHPRLKSPVSRVLSPESSSRATQDSGHRTQDSPYPFPSLCGAGVAFKLAWQFAKVHTGSERVPETFRNLLLDLLSVAALGTVADVVPLVDENRIISAGVQRGGRLGQDAG